MDERARRQWAAAEAAVLGLGRREHCGSIATGLARNTMQVRHVRIGVSPGSIPRSSSAHEFVTRAAVARRLTETDPGLLAALEALVDPATRGHPGIAVALDVQEHAQVGRGT